MVNNNDIIITCYIIVLKLAKHLGGGLISNILVPADFHDRFVGLIINITSII